NHSVIVKINDRMAQNNPKIIDVSRRAAEKLGFIEQGRVSVTLETVKTRRSSDHTLNAAQEKSFTINRASISKYQLYASAQEAYARSAATPSGLSRGSQSAYRHTNSPLWV